MAVVVTINSQDKTDHIIWDSLVVENVITNKVDTCRFKIRNRDDKIYKPSLGQGVIITDNGTVIFGGVIIKRTERADNYKIIIYEIECVDYTRLMDKKLVPDSFENQTVAQIIENIKDNYLPAGFTTSNVNCDVVIKYIGFNYLPVSKCFEELANLTNFDWYVDENKDIHFFSKEANTAPFSLNDDDGSYDFNSLVIRRDNSQIKNSIIVRGGEYLGTQFTSEMEADGVSCIFNLPYKYRDFEATLSSTKLNIGIDYINDAENYDALYNFQEKLLRFKELDKPSSGAVIKFAGKPYLPVIIKLKSQVDIDSMTSAEGIDGEYQYVIIDKSIDSREGARQKARSEIALYATTLSEAGFTTEKAGLRPGQRIHIVSSARGLDEYFIINRVSTVMFTPTAMKYNISLVTTKTMDMIDLLQKLLLKQNKEITIDKDEIIDLIESADETITLVDTVTTADHNLQTETITMGETFTAQSLDYETSFVVGGQHNIPSGKKRQFLIGGSKLNK